LSEGFPEHLSTPSPEHSLKKDRRPTQNTICDISGDVGSIFVVFVLMFRSLSTPQSIGRGKSPANIRLKSLCLNEAKVSVVLY
jgi:hypothetical protein